MNTKRHGILAAALMLGAVAAASPLQAHQRPNSATGQEMMMKGGEMGSRDMMGMMNMMEQMSKMMGQCSKMMEAAMKDMDGPKSQMPMDGQNAPEKKN